VIQVFVTIKGRTVGRYEFDQDCVRMGRLPENEVALDSMAVSRHHCELRRSSEGWKAKDLGSGNGTFLNGSRMLGEVPVKDGDSLGVGQFQVLIRTNAVSTGEPTHTEGPELRERSAPLKGYLAYEGRVGNEVLIEQDVLQVGSGGEVDLRIDGPAKLALIVRGYGGIQLVNVAPGQAPVQVGGHEVVDRRWLTSGDRLRLNQLVVVFHEGSPTGGEQTVQIQVSALKLTPPSGLPEAQPVAPPPPPPPPPPA
jgi:hypothetical protein